MLRTASAAALLAAASGCGEARPAAGTRSDPCATCHGDPSRAATALNPRLPSAPPVDTRGNSSPSSPRVGSHQVHLTDSALSRAVACGNCHDVPKDVAHATSGASVVVWSPGTLATTGGAAPTWTPGSLTCSATYCHGNFDYDGVTGSTGPTPAWTSAPTYACGTCHGIPPLSPHPQDGVSDCGGCHPGYASSSVNLDLHLNGKPDLGGGGIGCASCHGYPPATGAHAVHVGVADDPSTARYGETSILQDLFPAATPSTAPQAYFFGCGNCHPLDPSRHMDGTVEVELLDPAAPVGSLKALSPAGAAYTTAPGDPYGTCSNVYCHSSGQAAGPTTPVFAATPRWDRQWAPAVKNSCTGCHANPPRYDSGGAGTVTANTHVQLADDGWELGHYDGLLGPWHTTFHGAFSTYAQESAPITCQACHYETVSASNAGPTGFYYLDTSGGYELPGGDTTRQASPYWPTTQCATCHPSVAAAGTGEAMPLRHVNGARDVVFDPRDTAGALASYAGAPADPATRPYWIVGLSGTPGSLPAGAIFQNGVWSAHLRDATYDPPTKTCSNVACHLGQTQVQWGVTPVGWATCDACHGMAAP